jgi:hypothetical protein
MPRGTLPEASETNESVDDNIIAAKVPSSEQPVRKRWYTVWFHQRKQSVIQNRHVVVRWLITVPVYRQYVHVPRIMFVK